METVFLNGEFTPIDEAKISVLDRGWVFGDGVYEVIPVYNGFPFRLKEHLQRLKKNLQAIQISQSYSDSEWSALIDTLISKNISHEATAVYLQITRGIAKRDHVFPKTSTPSVFIMVQPVDHHSIRESRKGIRAITHRDIRWEYCHIKSISLLANVLLKQEAKQLGADEALLIRNGFITEGAASNLFIVHKEVLLTPPKSQHLLPGITRDLVLELAKKHRLPYKEQDIPVEMLSTATEIWVSSSTKEILPVIHLDGQPVASGQPGPLWKQISQYYQQFKANFSGGNSSDVSGH